MKLPMNNNNGNDSNEAFYITFVHEIRFGYQGREVIRNFLTL